LAAGAGVPFCGVGLADFSVDFLGGAGAAARVLPLAAAFGAACGRFADLADLPLEAAAVLAVLAGVALRTGAFSAAERFPKGFGDADLDVSLRFLAEDFGAALCGAGREEDLLSALMTESLMRSTRFSQIAPRVSRGRFNAGSLT
jgi:hypothetical protein